MLKKSFEILTVRLQITPLCDWELSAAMWYVQGHSCKRGFGRFRTAALMRDGQTRSDER